MLSRYTLPPMQELWRDKRKYKEWLRVELAVLAARVRLGELREEIYRTIKTHTGFNEGRIAELEEQYLHDMLAFIGAVQESLPPVPPLGNYEREVHKKVTSYDIEDPALILILREAVTLILVELRALRNALGKKAAEHKWTLIIARTHGQYAEPSTFGLLLLAFAEAVSRSIERLEFVLDHELSEGKISGAVGTYAGLSPELERFALDELGLLAAKAETQILQRDRHAMLVAALAVAGATIEQMCEVFWLMMQSDVGELAEPFWKRQRGSSAMPHKRNPILMERLRGLPRVLRGACMAALENVATSWWRDISQSSVERHIFPDATAVLHYMAVKMTAVVENLVVYPDRMKENFEKSFGVWAGQRVRAALIDAGVDYNVSYNYIQRLSFEAKEEGVHLSSLLRERQIDENETRTAEDILGKEPLKKLFGVESYIAPGVRHIFKKCSR